MKPVKVVSIIVIIIILLPCWGGDAPVEGRWFAGLYGGQGTDGSEKEVFIFKADYMDSYIAAVILGKELLTWNNYLRFEVEGQVVRHFGTQDHFEFNALFVARWLPFPWDSSLDTSFAIGDGLSYATRDSEIEVLEHEGTSKILNYLMFERALSVPRYPDWSTFARFHHRCGIFGLINRMFGGSNFIGGGVKYTF